MKANELMIGDWVFVSKNFTQKYHKIRALSNDEGAVLRGIYVNEYGIESNSVFSPNDTEPIPLTPEILEKNGFERVPQISDVEPSDVDEEGNKHYSYNKAFWGCLQPDNIFCIPANGMGWLYIKYVHQLQHALRLCGIEKEIIL